MVSYALLFSLPVVLAGAWYLVNPQWASPLASFEGEKTNRLRRRLRRVNGAVMLASGILLFYIISKVMWLTAEPGRTPGLVLPFTCIALVPLLVTMLCLAFVDMRMTGRMRRRMREGHAGSDRPPVPALALLLALSLLVGCDNATDAPAADTNAPATVELVSSTADDDAEGEPQELPTVDVTIGDAEIKMMVADDFDERRTGMMHRKEVGPDEGMLFVFPDVDFRSFWMRNTLVPLDIIFLDARMRVLNVGRGEPLDENNSVRSVGRAKYVVELAAGRADELGLKRGTVIDLPESARETDE